MPNNWEKTGSEERFIGSFENWCREHVTPSFVGGAIEYFRSLVETYKEEIAGIRDAIEVIRPEPGEKGYRVYSSSETPPEQWGGWDAFHSVSKPTLVQAIRELLSQETAFAVDKEKIVAASPNTYVVEDVEYTPVLDAKGSTVLEDSDPRVQLYNLARKINQRFPGSYEEISFLLAIGTQEEIKEP